MNTPHEIAEKRMELSALFANATEQLKNILTFKPAVWSELRKGVKSDKAADRMCEASEDGIKEMRLRLSMKSMEKEMSACRTMLEVLTIEAKNII